MIGAINPNMVITPWKSLQVVPGDPSSTIFLVWLGCKGDWKYLRSDPWHCYVVLIEVNWLPFSGKLLVAQFHTNANRPHANTRFPNNTVMAE